MQISRFKRRNLSLIAGVLALALTVTSFSANGDEVTGGGRLGESGVIFNDTTGDGVAAPPDTTASSYIIADLDTGEILAAKNPHKRLPPASTLKTLTALTLLPKLDMNKTYIDTKNITDFLMEAYDGFIDIVEIKRPDGNLNFWAKYKDHDNYVPDQDLVKAITQATKYIYEIEREANSIKFLDRVDGVKTIKPRCVLIYGRSDDWNNEQKESFRILNSNYHNLNIMTYDHILERAKRMIK